jgi:rhodanese-related sulfurtransferase
LVIESLKRHPWNRGDASGTASTNRPLLTASCLRRAHRRHRHPNKENADMQTISREQVKRKINSNDNVVVIETLDPKYYEKFHLPNAINIPLDERFDQQVQQKVPDKNTPVIVYCMDKECDASPKAAKRLEKLGYENVFDYEEGKVDWKKAGEKIED